MTTKKFRNIVFMTIWILTFIYIIVAYFFVLKPTSISTPPSSSWTTVKNTLTNNTSLHTRWTNLSLCYKKTCFDVQIAKTRQEREQWLMWVSNLNAYSWMLFVFSENKKYGFWMKNTLIPLDIIRMDKQFHIVDFTTMIPCHQQYCPSYKPSQPARYVVEINAGWNKKLNIQTGATRKITNN